MLAKFKFVFFILICLPIGIMAQINSPLSGSGVGQTIDENSARFKALGGSSVAVKDSLNVNVSNPASYADFSKVNFETGLNYALVQQNLNGLSRSENNAWVPFFRYGIPLFEQKMGMAFGIATTSSKSFDYQDSLRISHEGEPFVYRWNVHGDLSKTFIGFGFNVLPKEQKQNLNIGLNYNYHFGRTFESKLYYVQYLPKRNSDFLDYGYRTNYFASGTSLDFGVQYAKNWTKKTRVKQLTIGGTYSPNYTLNTLANKYHETGVFLASSNTIGQTSSIPYNLVSSEEDVAGNIEMPNKKSFGLTYEIKNIENAYEYPEWLFTLEASQTQYSSMSTDGENQGFNDLNRLSFGMSYRPKSEGLRDQVRYRLGFFGEQSHLVMNGNPYQHIGMTIGAGIPLVKSKNSLGKNFSKINFALTVGQKKTPIITDYSEIYVNAFLGFTISNKWFVRNKIK